MSESDIPNPPVTQEDTELSRPARIAPAAKETLNSNMVANKPTPLSRPGESVLKDGAGKFLQTEESVSRSVLRAPRLSATDAMSKMVGSGRGIDFSQALRASGRMVGRLEQTARQAVVVPGAKMSSGGINGITIPQHLAGIKTAILDSTKLSDALLSANTAASLSSLQLARTMSANYMRKNLALSYEGVAIAKSMLRVTGAMADMIESKLEAIKSNTAAPETSKAGLISRLKSEIRAQLVKNKATQIIGAASDVLNQYVKQPAMRQLTNLRQGKGLSGTIKDARDSVGDATTHFGDKLREIVNGHGRPRGNTGENGLADALENLSDRISLWGKHLKSSDFSQGTRDKIDKYADKVLSRIPGFYKDPTEGPQPPPGADDSEPKPHESSGDPILDTLMDIRSILEEWPKCKCAEDASPSNTLDRRRKKREDRKSATPKETPKRHTEPRLDIPPSPESRIPTPREVFGPPKPPQGEVYGPPRPGGFIRQRMGMLSEAAHSDRANAARQDVRDIYRSAQANARLGVTSFRYNYALADREDPSQGESVSDTELDDLRRNLEEARAERDTLRESHGIRRLRIARRRFGRSRLGRGIASARDAVGNAREALADRLDPLQDTLTHALENHGISDATPPQPPSPPTPVQEEPQVRPARVHRSEPAPTPRPPRPEPTPTPEPVHDEEPHSEISDVLDRARSRLHGVDRRRRYILARRERERSLREREARDATPEVPESETPTPGGGGILGAFKESYSGLGLGRLPDMPNLGFLKDAFVDGRREGKTVRDAKRPLDARRRRFGHGATENLIERPVEGVGLASRAVGSQVVTLLKDLKSLFKREVTGNEADRKGRSKKPRKNSWQDYVERLDEGHERLTGKAFDATVRGGRRLLHGAGILGKAVGGSLEKGGSIAGGLWDGTKGVLEDMFGATLLGKYLVKPGWKVGSKLFGLGGTAARLGGSATGAVGKGLWKGLGLKSLLSGAGGAAKWGLVKSLTTDFVFSKAGEMLKDYSDEHSGSSWGKAGGYAGSALQYGAYGLMLGGPWGAAIGAAVGLLVQACGGLGGTLKAIGHGIGKAFGYVEKAAVAVGHGIGHLWHFAVGRRAKVRRDGSVVSQGHYGVIGETLGHLFGSKDLKTQTGEIYQKGHKSLIGSAFHGLGHKTSKFFFGDSYSDGTHILGSSGIDKLNSWGKRNMSPISSAHADTLPTKGIYKPGSHPASGDTPSSDGKNPADKYAATKADADHQLSYPTTSIVSGLESDPSKATFGWERVSGHITDRSSPYVKFMAARLEMYGIHDDTMGDFVRSMENHQTWIWENGKKGLEFDDYAAMATKFGFDSKNRDAVLYFMSWYQRRFIPVCNAVYMLMKQDHKSLEAIYLLKDEDVKKYIPLLKTTLSKTLSRVAGLEPSPDMYRKYVQAATKAPKGRAATDMKPVADFSPVKPDLSSGSKASAAAREINKAKNMAAIDMSGIKINSDLMPSSPGAKAVTDAALSASMSTGDITKTEEYTFAFNLLTKTVQDRVKSSPALQFVLWSTSIQHGGKGAAKIFETDYNSREDDATYIRKIYQDRSTKFADQSVGNRNAALSHNLGEEQFADGILGGKNASFADMQNAVGNNPIMAMGDATLPAGKGTPTPEQQKKRAKQAYDFFVQQKKYTPAAAAGLIANIRQESQFNEGSVGDNGSAIGIGQWHADRRKAIEAHFKKRIIDMSFEEQLEAYDWEMRTGADAGAGTAFKMLQGQTDPDKAGQIVSKYMERPGATPERRLLEAANRGANAKVMLAELQTDDKKAAPDNKDSGPSVQTAVDTVPVGTAADKFNAVHSETDGDSDSGGDATPDTSDATTPSTGDTAAATPPADKSAASGSGSAPAAGGTAPAAAPAVSDTPAPAADTTPPPSSVVRKAPASAPTSTPQKAPDPIVATIDPAHTSSLDLIAKNTSKTTDLLGALIQAVASTGSGTADLLQKHLDMAKKSLDKPSGTNIIAPAVNMAASAPREKSQISYSKQGNRSGEGGG